MSVNPRLPSRPVKHIENMNNPHKVTAEQVGACANLGKITQEIFDDATYPIPYIGTVYGINNLPSTTTNHQYRMLYLPYFSNKEGYSVQVLFGCVETYGMWFRKSHGKNWYEWRKVLDNTGGTLSNEKLYINGGKALLRCDENSMGLYTFETADDTKDYSATDSSGLTIYAKNYAEQASVPLNNRLRVRIDGTGYKVFGEHNKPTGTYTGNGDATARTIDTGGIGQVVLIYSDTFGSVILTYVNGISWLAADGVQVISQGNGYFRNGIITLKTTLKYLNQSGITYHYRVL